MRRLFFTASILLFTIVLVRVVLSFFLSPQIVDGQQINFRTAILSEPTQTGNLYTFPVSFSNGWGSKVIRVTTPQEFSYGQSIKIAGTVKERLLKNQQVAIAIYFPTITIVPGWTGIPLSMASSLRHKIQSIYDHALTKDEASLLLGIVLGVKGNFSPNLLQAFKLTGVMHVIAASGMNVTMLAGFLVALLGRYFKRQHVGTATLFMLIVYCILAGMQPSIVRATIMGSLGLVAQLWGRQYSGLYGLFLAASIMLLFNPTLVIDVGFQLSFASSLGILLLHPHFLKIPFFSEDVATTISSQIATLPILLLTFGQYGLLSILVNFLVLWTIAPLMILGGVSAIIGLVWQPLGSLISLFSLPLLWYFEKVILFFGNLNLTLTFNTLPAVTVVGYYGLVVAVLWYLYIRRKQRESQS